MHLRRHCLVFVISTTTWIIVAHAECAIDDAVRQFDPVEVGYCESDAVFIGEVVGRMETMRAFREEGTEVTKHFNTERSTMRVIKSFKGNAKDKVTMLAELYDKQGAYRFTSGNTYLVFAKRLSGENEFAGASAACSVQPTLPIEDAEQVLKKLEQRKKIDCAKIRSK